MAHVIGVNKDICLLTEDGANSWAERHRGGLVGLLRAEGCTRFAADCFCAYRFGRRDAGKRERAKNRIIIFPGLPEDNYSRGGTLEAVAAATTHRDTEYPEHHLAYGN